MPWNKPEEEDHKHSGFNQCVHISLRVVASHSLHDSLSLSLSLSYTLVYLSRNKQQIKCPAFAFPFCGCKDPFFTNGSILEEALACIIKGYLLHPF
jgi:hypothetical protein